ncbi:hypothetical protein BZG02_06330 [Labilibaculum filiforme]|uniref:SPOR domain-containing protein n=1 Tax=Labilibaculum filiforme TaxID=1940526 RepID=A0A2N3I296_9BACT|nr:SPOR domain-containing protein [Labilibaculum filiforme]PKQ64422.1 hypothetical protein BZG02_06330 [Labilibaculum filiforme]
MRNIYFLICFFLTVGTIGSFSPFFDINFTGSTAGGTSYGVEIAKFKYPVYTDYFEELDDVVELSGKNGEYHYISGITTSKGEAEKRVEEIKSFGYADAKVLDLNHDFSAEEIAAVVSKENKVQDNTKKQKITSKTIKKNADAELAISKLTNIGNDYFYSVLLQKSQEILNAESFSPHASVKVFEINSKFYYLLGRFEDVGDAKNYLQEELADDFPNAKVVVINKGELVEVKESERKNREVKIASNSVGSYNMGRKMRGKEYVDYYYELGSLQGVENPLYTIEIGAYQTKESAKEAVQKLKDLGFTQARIKTPDTQKTKVAVENLSPTAHFTIQVFASKLELNTKRIPMKDLTQTYDPQDELYRYFYGNYDNYWVCRRELREVRQKGYSDAFIVRL